MQLTSGFILIIIIHAATLEWVPPRHHREDQLKAQKSSSAAQKDGEGILVRDYEADVALDERTRQRNLMAAIQIPQAKPAEVEELEVSEVIVEEISSTVAPSMRQNAKVEPSKQKSSILPTPKPKSSKTGKTSAPKRKSGPLSTAKPKISKILSTSKSTSKNAILTSQTQNMSTVPFPTQNPQNPQNPKSKIHTTVVTLKSKASEMTVNPTQNTMAPPDSKTAAHSTSVAPKPITTAHHRKKSGLSVISPKSKTSITTAHPKRKQGAVLTKKPPKTV